MPFKPEYEVNIFLLQWPMDRRQAEFEALTDGSQDLTAGHRRRFT
jgi:hypothetical protein